MAVERKKKTVIGTSSNPTPDLGAYLNVRTSHHAWRAEASIILKLLQ